MSASPRHTSAPAKYLVLYDGHCRFCEAQSRKLAGWMRPGSVERVDFQRPGELDRFPGLTWDACMEKMHLVTPMGQVFVGAEAICRALATIPILGQLAWLYYLPGVRRIFDRVYAMIAARRYRLMGRAMAAGSCEGGTCAVHFGAKK